MSQNAQVDSHTSGETSRDRVTKWIISNGGTIPVIDFGASAPEVGSTEPARWLTDSEVLQKS
jgi:hypothetical protein